MWQQEAAELVKPNGGAWGSSGGALEFLRLGFDGFFETKALVWVVRTKYAI